MIHHTDFSFPVPFTKYSGKVRDTYNLQDELLVIVATDRISAFDVILPQPIPFKGQVLNQTAAYFLEHTRDICPNHVIAVPDPNVTIGMYCKPFPVEMVVRGYLAGHAWRTYQSGLRELCGVRLPDGLKENDPLPEPILTPTTKSHIGHDEDISEQDILKSGLVDSDDWGLMRHYAFELYKRGAAMAQERGLILVDTKYEFGERDGEIYLIDEIHTPDSSRYFYLEGYEERQVNGEPQKQLSKEFVRKWLIDHHFMGKEGQQVPAFPETFVHEISARYIELYEQVTGKSFLKRIGDAGTGQVYHNIIEALKGLGMQA